ncbi:MAG: ABC transporter permease [Clostridiales bacterium]|nr:ABC transporter permease [Clostridiales bacterium]
MSRLRILPALKALIAIKPKQKLTAQYLLSLFIAIVLAFLVGAGIMLLCGYDPIECYAALFRGALGKPRAFGNTLAKTATLCLTGLAMSVAAKAGIFNVGGEGQLYFGGLAAAVVGARLAGAPAWVIVVCALLAAVFAGGLYAWVPGILKVKLKVNEVVTTILLNSAAIYFCSYLTNGPLKTAERGISSGTDSIAVSFSPIIRLSNLNGSIWIAFAAALIIWYLMTRSTAGFEMKITGANERFAKYGGIRADRLMIAGMVISGMLCGLVGMIEVFGIHKRFITNLSAGYYFDGMLVAMIMRYQPFGVIVMSFFFAILTIGGSAMELSAGISGEVILIVQAVIIFFMAAEGGIRQSLRVWSAKRRVKRTHAKEAGV